MKTPAAPAGRIAAQIIQARREKVKVTKLPKAAKKTLPAMMQD